MDAAMGSPILIRVREGGLPVIAIGEAPIGAAKRRPHFIDPNAMLPS